MEPRDVIEEPDFCKAPSSCDLQATWTRHACINITWNEMEHWVAAREHSFGEQLYRLSIERVQVVIDRRVRTEFVASQ